MTLKRSLKSTVKIHLALYSAQTFIWAAFASFNVAYALDARTPGGMAFYAAIALGLALLTYDAGKRVYASVKVLRILRKHPELVYLAEIQHQFGNNSDA